MAFITIRKANRLLNVSKSMFENFYANAGWVEADDKKSASIANQKAKQIQAIVPEDKEEEKVEEETFGSSDDEWEEALDEVDDDEEAIKPISEMTRSELVEFADKNDISLAGLSKTNQFRNAIKEAMSAR